MEKIITKHMNKFFKEGVCRINNIEKQEILDKLIEHYEYSIKYLGWNKLEVFRLTRNHLERLNAIYLTEELQKTLENINMNLLNRLRWGIK